MCDFASDRPTTRATSTSRRISFSTLASTCTLSSLPSLLTACEMFSNCESMLCDRTLVLVSQNAHSQSLTATHSQRTAMCVNQSALECAWFLERVLAPLGHWLARCDDRSARHVASCARSRRLFRMSLHNDVDKHALTATIPFQCRNRRTCDHTEDSYV